jgi:hypothetical protein
MGWNVANEVECLECVLNNINKKPINEFQWMDYDGWS